jgi:hypothetical protein
VDVLETEYHRILLLGSYLQMEEIMTEILVGEGQNAAVFFRHQPAIQRLQDIRVLLGVAQRGVAFFKECCEEHGLHLDFADLDEQHLCHLQEHEPFRLLEPFLDQSVGLKAFTDLGQVGTAGCNQRCMASDMFTYNSDLASSSSGSSESPRRKSCWLESVQTLHWHNATSPVSSPG